MNKGLTMRQTEEFIQGYAEGEKDRASEIVEQLKALKIWYRSSSDGALLNREGGDVVLIDDISKIINEPV